MITSHSHYEYSKEQENKWTKGRVNWNKYRKESINNRKTFFLLRCAASVIVVRCKSLPFQVYIEHVFDSTSAIINDTYIMKVKWRETVRDHRQAFIERSQNQIDKSQQQQQQLTKWIISHVHIWKRHDGRNCVNFPWVGVMQAENFIMS